jgi:hypothetical protein
MWKILSLKSIYKNPLDGFIPSINVNICQDDINSCGAWVDEKTYYEFSPTSTGVKLYNK